VMHNQATVDIYSSYFSQGSYGLVSWA